MGYSVSGCISVAHSGEFKIFAVTIPYRVASDPVRSSTTRDASGGTRDAAKPDTGDVFVACNHPRNRWHGAGRLLATNASTPNAPDDPARGQGRRAAPGASKPGRRIGRRSDAAEDNVRDLRTPLRKAARVGHRTGSGLGASFGHGVPSGQFSANHVIAASYLRAVKDAPSWRRWMKRQSPVARRATVTSSIPRAAAYAVAQAIR